MAGPVRVAFVIFLAAAAGCADGPPPKADGAATPPDAPGGWELRNDADHCMEQVAVLFIEMEQAQAALPPGFEADDAQQLLGLPAPVGQSAAFFNAVDCGDSWAAEVAVPIKPPTLANTTLPATQYSLYQLGYASSNASLVQRLADLGFPAVGGQATSTASLNAAGGTGRSDVAAGDLAYSFEAIMGPSEPFPGTARFWHQVDQGIVHLEYDFVSTARKGTLTSCSMPAGSVLHDLTGWRDCQGHAAAFVAIPDQSWQGTARFLAGASLA